MLDPHSRQLLVDIAILACIIGVAYLMWCMENSIREMKEELATLNRLIVERMKKPLGRRRNDW